MSDETLEAMGEAAAEVRRLEKRLAGAEMMLQRAQTAYDNAKSAFDAATMKYEDEKTKAKTKLKAE